MASQAQVEETSTHGDVDDGFGAVADAFRRNFQAGDEIGAACAVYQHGRKVADLRGGYADGGTRRPWQRDTMLVVFSTTKGMTGTAMAVAHARGLFELDERVAAYWPEFAQNGKQDITVRQLLAHQAGLPVCRGRIRLETAADHARLGEILAAQRPIWEPGTRHGYHSVTMAWFESQLLSRVDPDGRTLGRFFADEVAAPLSAEFHIGLPDGVPDERIAKIHSFRPHEMLFNLDKMPARMVLSFFNPRGVFGRSMRLVPELMKPDAFNRREILRMELPSVNGVGEGRAIAVIYGDMATGGGALGLTPGTLRALEEPATEPTGGRRDVTIHQDTAFSMGYVKPCPALPFGSSSRAYGTPGAGGSFAFADPDAGLGYAYVMNRLSMHSPVDPGELAIRQALYAAIDGPPQGGAGTAPAMSVAGGAGDPGPQIRLRRRCCALRVRVEATT